MCIRMRISARCRAAPRGSPPARRASLRRRGLCRPSFWIRSRRPPFSSIPLRATMAAPETRERVHAGCGCAKEPLVVSTNPLRNRIPRRAIVFSWFVICLSLSIAFVAYLRWTHRHVSRVDVYDGFEAPKLSAIWDTNRFARGAVTMQSAIVRAGRGAAKVVVHSRDVFEAGINGNEDTERAELLEASELVSKEDVTYEYSFSMYLPADFPIVPTRLVIAQWKQDCDAHANR